MYVEYRLFFQNVTQEVFFLQHISTLQHVLTSWETAPHNRYQPQPAEPEQHIK